MISSRRVNLIRRGFRGDICSTFFRSCASAAEQRPSQSKHVAQFKKWILTHPSINNPRIDDSFLMRFLRCNGFNLDASKSHLKRYLASRDSHPECFKRLDITSVSLFDLMSRGYVFPLLESDAEGRRVVFIRSKAYCPRRGHRPRDMFRSLIMTLETLLEDEQTQRNGLVYIIDFEGLSILDVASAGVFRVEKLARNGQKAMPCSHEKAHWLHASKSVRACFWFCLDFAPDDLKQRIQFHDNVSSLRSTFDPRLLPKEYGGSVSVQEMVNIWVNKLRHNRNNLLALDLMYYSHKNRPPKNFS